MCAKNAHNVCNSIPLSGKKFPILYPSLRYATIPVASELSRVKNVTLSGWWKMTINKRLYGHWVSRREAGTAVIRIHTHKELGPPGGKAVP
jgi:hypothetical protein